MYLINTKTMELEEFIDENSVKYAILSHRWGKEEVSFQDMHDKHSDVHQKLGYDKIRECSRLATIRGLSYVWVDTCCINKQSCAELQEAINSMYRWYANSVVCFAFLTDCKPYEPDDFHRSVWFTRGWTLQELIAPRQVEFYDSKWSLIGPLAGDMIKKVSDVTKIPESVLDGSPYNLSQYTVAEKMSWAKDRKTTRVEDRAYSLMGIFDVNMPMLYGEGKKAFIRLQEEILRTSNDQSILAWNLEKSSEHAILAESPDSFPSQSAQRCWGKSFEFQRRIPPNLTCGELHAEFRLTPIVPDVYLAIFNYHGPDVFLFEGIFIKKVDDDGRFVRILHPNFSSIVRGEWPSESDCTSHFYRRVQVTLVAKLMDWEIYRRDSWPVAAFCVGSDLQVLQDKPPVHCLIEIQNKRERHLCGPVLYVVCPQNRYIDVIMLGFDFDFNPVVVLRAHHRRSSKTAEVMSMTDVRFKEMGGITCMEPEGWLSLGDMIEAESGAWHVWPFKLDTKPDDSDRPNDIGRYVCRLAIRTNVYDPSPGLVQFELSRADVSQPWDFTLSPHFHHSIGVERPISGYVCERYG